MKATIKLINPDEQFEVEIDAWSRMMFERNAVKFGLPATPAADAARQFPETFMCICTYFALKKNHLINGVEFPAFELRWDGLVAPDDQTKDALLDPTNAAPQAE